MRIDHVAGVACTLRSSPARLPTPPAALSHPSTATPPGGSSAASALRRAANSLAFSPGASSPGCNSSGWVADMGWPATSGAAPRAAAAAAATPPAAPPANTRCAARRRPPVVTIPPPPPGCRLLLRLYAGALLLVLSAADAAVAGCRLALLLGQLLLFTQIDACAAPDAPLRLWLMRRAVQQRPE